MYTHTHARAHMHTHTQTHTHTHTHTLSNMYVQYVCVYVQYACVFSMSYLKLIMDSSKKGCHDGRMDVKCFITKVELESALQKGKQGI